MSSDSAFGTPDPSVAQPKRLNAFDRYLSVWVAASMAVGLLIGRAFPGVSAALRGLELGDGSHVFSPWIGPELAGQYLAGVIILAAAPCTAMVFVWSYLADGDPAYTLVQVAVNDLVMLVAFAPIVKVLVTGAAGLEVPFRVLVVSVLVFVVIPLVLGAASRAVLVARRGVTWFEERFVRAFAPLTTVALLATLTLIFAFQADNITGRSLHVLLIAVPILIQVYFNSSLTYGLMRLAGVEYSVAAPGALIGASNFFELAVATAIALYGPGSGVTLATVVGVLVEVPVMLSVCRACVATRHWFPVPGPRIS
jgi:ACR3 family arsenite transporter